VLATDCSGRCGVEAPTMTNSPETAETQGCSNRPRLRHRDGADQSLHAAQGTMEPVMPPPDLDLPPRTHVITTRIPIKYLIRGACGPVRSCSSWRTAPRISGPQGCSNRPREWTSERLMEVYMQSRAWWRPRPARCLRAVSRTSRISGGRQCMRSENRWGVWAAGLRMKSPQTLIYLRKNP
jgi:hypothetical protein